MPFKSDAQRKWMYANHPKMAARWEKHTSKHKKLPAHVGEMAGDGVSDEPERTGHESFDVQDISMDMDPLGLRTEMPHIDADIDVGGKHIGTIDLRIERYPISNQEKQRLMRAFDKTGVVGDLNGELVHFRHDSVEVIDKQAAKQLPKLPAGWEKIMKFVSESASSSLRIENVFRRK